MRSVETSSETACFMLVSAGYKAATGRLAVAVGRGLVAELDDRDLDQSWTAAGGLTDSEALEISETAGLQLMEFMGKGLDAATLATATVDAALLFLLAMRRHGIADPRRIPACAVKWTSAGTPACIRLAS